MEYSNASILPDRGRRLGGCLLLGFALAGGEQEAGYGLPAVALTSFEPVGPDGGVRMQAPIRIAGRGLRAAGDDGPVASLAQDPTRAAGEGLVEFVTQASFARLRTIHPEAT